jgi:hypothetical protein
MDDKEAILRLSSGRTHLGILMDFFDRFENWESYLKAAVLFHAYDELLKAKLKENT